MGKRGKVLLFYSCHQKGVWLKSLPEGGPSVTGICATWFLTKYGCVFSVGAVNEGCHSSQKDKVHCKTYR